MTTEEKSRLVDLWSQVALGTGEKPQDVAGMKNADMKQWIYASLMREVKELGKEWGFLPDTELIEAIAQESDPRKKANLQLRYITACNAQFKEFRAEKSGSHDSRWDTMPLTMRENRDFNCVGASLLGHALFDEGGIENFFGSPVGHAVNVVRLGDGSFWYVDLRNDFMHRMDPEMLEISKVKTAKMHYPANVYKYVPLYEAIEMPIFILGNLLALKEESEHEESIAESPREGSAKQVWKRFEGQFSKVQSDDFQEALYSEIGAASRSEIMQHERMRVEKLREIKNNFFKSIHAQCSQSQWEEGIGEIRDRAEVAEKYLLYGEGADGFGAAAQHILTETRKKLEEEEGENSELFDEIMEYIVALIITKR